MSAHPPLPLPHAPRWGETFDVQIDRLDERGRGVADLRVSVVGDERSYRITVPTAIPGDRVTVRIGKPRRRKVDGRVVAQLSPSPAAVTPPCPHFGPYDAAGRGCGGCALQRLGLEAQRDWKQRRVAGLLAEAGLDPGVVAPTLAAPAPLRYRNKMEFSFGDDAERAPTLGLHPTARRHEVIDVGDCLLVSEGANAVVAAARAWRLRHGLRHHDARRGLGWLRTLVVREGLRTGERMVELITADARPDASDPAPLLADLQEAFAGLRIDSLWWTRHDARRGRPTQLHSALLAGRPTLREELHIADQPPLRFDIHPRAFFQPSTGSAELLYSRVHAALGEATGHVLDLYCGTGTIALTLAGRVAQVTGIERSAEAVDNAIANAELNGVDNVRFICGDAGATLAAEGLSEPGAADAVVVDPPRAGLSGKALEHVARIGAPRLVYVSCNPASLARDAAALSDYRLVRAEPVDHFPQTGHVETVATLERD